VAAPQYPGYLGASRSIKSCKGERNRLANNFKQNDTTQLTMENSAESAPQITNSAEERVEVTHFTEDLATLAEPAPGEVPLTTIGSQQHTDSRIHSIISFLQRPQVIDTFQFGPGNNRNSLLGNSPYHVPDALLKPMYLNKLDGFTSFRATAVFKLQLNSQPFQAGRLLMMAVPMPSFIAPRDKWLVTHISQAQSIHNVQIDISKQTEIELRIPFISPYNSYDLINGQYRWSDLNIMVYSPLNEVEQVPLEIVLWGHFEDIELGAPTSGVAKQQSGRVQPKAGVPAPKEPSKELINALRDKEATGAISKISSGAQQAYSKAGKAFPGLKPITDLFSTLSSISSSLFGGILGGLPLVGKLFGFSKPPLSHSGNTVVVRPTQYFANTDGIDHSLVLALDALNAVDMYPTLGGTNMSETSFTYLKKIPQYIDCFCYGKNDTYGKVLYSSFVYPRQIVPAVYSLQGEGEVSDINTYQPTVLNYISSIFNYWTGSLVYTIRFVKTDFHSGRVEVSYHPFVNKPETSRMDYVYRLVIDLRDNSEVSFVVPFISPQPWKSLGFRNEPEDYLNPDGNPFIPDWSKVGDSITGTIAVRALTPLICSNAIVANNIECLIEMRAGDDYEVQAPVKNVYLPYRLVGAVAQQQSGRVYAVPGTQETRTTAIEGFLPPSITGSDADIEREDTVMYCAGESFQDFNALTRRFSFTEKVKITAKSYLMRQGCYYVRSPALIQDQWTNGTPAYEVWRFTSDLAPTPLTFVSSMYAFYRGSYRVKTYQESMPDLVSGRVIDMSAYTFNLDGTTNLLNYIAPKGYEQPEDKKFAEYQIPYYSPTVVSVPWPMIGGSTEYTQPTVALMLANSGSEDVEMHIAIAASDDMTFHSFMGVPICIPQALMANTVNPPGSPGPIGIFDPTVFDVDPCLVVNEAAVLSAEWKDSGNSRIVSIGDFKITDLTSKPSGTTLCPPDNIQPPPKTPTAVLV